MIKFFKKIIKAISDYFTKLENDPQFREMMKYELEKKQRNLWYNRF